MNTFRKIWESIFPPIHPLPAGMYTFQSPADAPEQYRLHLRLEPDGHGVLIVNASTMVHLNPTAAEIAYHLVKNTPEDDAVVQIAGRYNVAKEIVRRDYAEMVDRLRALINTPDLDPVASFDFDRQDPYSGATTAPYRIDCALTYHQPEQSAGHFAPVERVSRELVTEEWQQIIDKAWNAGVPHVIFTGGEPTLRPDLCTLVAYAEKLGMVAGVITNGLRLSESHYLHELLQSGLDHLMLMLEPDEEQSWEALRDVLAEDIAVTVHLTLTPHNLPRIDTTLQKLQEMGVPNISLSAASVELKDALQEKRNISDRLGLRLVWDLPVPYSYFHPVAVELAGDMPDVDAVMQGPGRAWLYVEPDGDVLPGQGYYQNVLGNLLTEKWETVWKNATA